MELFKLLIQEVSLDMLKKQFVDTKKITPQDFEAIKKATDKKSAYATWLTSRVAKKFIKPEDIYKWEGYFDIFDRRKKDYPHSDINQYKDEESIRDFVEKTIELRDLESTDASAQKGVAKDDKYGKYKLGDVAGFQVYKIPKGKKDLYNASCELGSGTEWCTASGARRNFFDDYIGDDDLYIFIKGKEKYQFHYQSKQFMDKNDNDILDSKTSAKTSYLYDFFKYLEQKEKRPIPIEASYIWNRKSLGDNVALEVDDSPYGSSRPDRIKPRLTPNMVVIRDVEINKPQEIPSGVRIGGDLNIRRSSGITVLPKDLKVDGWIDMRIIPDKYPEHLLDKIRVAGQPLRHALLYKSMSKEYTIDTPRFKKTFWGLEIQGYDSDTFKAVDDDTDLREFLDASAALKKNILLGLEWVKKYYSNAYDPRNERPKNTTVGHGSRYYAVGKYKGEDIVYVFKDSWQGSIVGPAKTMAITGSNVRKFTRMTDAKKQTLISSLMQKDYVKPSTKPDPDKITAGLKNGRLRYAELAFNDRIVRGGPGVKGPYTEYKKYIPSTTSQSNVEIAGKNLGVHWDEIVLYSVMNLRTQKRETLFAVKGTDVNGKMFFYDRAGVGAGGYSKIYSGKKKVNASEVINGDVKNRDFQ